MSSEVCPYCGKSFKRLKSHLPHCKAAKSSKTTSPRHEETNTSSSSSSLPPNPTQHSAKTDASLESKENKQATKTLKKPNSMKKTKMKLSEQIKMVSEMSSPTPVASTPPSLALKSKSPASSQTDKELIGNNVEKVKAKPQLKLVLSRRNNQEIIQANLEQRTLSQTEEQLPKPTDGMKNMDNSQSASKKKEVKGILTKKSGSNKAKVTVNNVKTSLEQNVWSGGEENERSLPENEKSSPENERSLRETERSSRETERSSRETERSSRETERSSRENDALNSRQEAKVTLHDVRAALGRARQNGRRKENSLVEELVKGSENRSVILLRETPSQLMSLTPEKSQLSPLKTGHFLRELSNVESRDCNFSQRAEVLRDGLRMDGHSRGLAALSSPARTFLEAEVSSEALRKDTAALFKANLQEAKREMEETRRDVRKRDERSARGALSQQRLGQVMLRELPDWLVSRSPQRPRDALQLLHRGWQWYYRRYIDVKKGGVGGVAMLLAGYCVLSYVWAFPHLKRERWRKYH